MLDGRGSTTVWNDAGQKHHLRVEGGRDLRHPAQHLAPALQRLGQGRRALRRRDQRAGDHQRLRRRRLRLQHDATTSRTASTASPTTSPTRASRRACCSTRTSWPTRSTCRSSPPRSAAPGGGAHPLQHGQGLHEQPHLAVSGGHLQEGPCPRPRRARHRHERRGLQPDVAGGRGAAALRVEGGDDDRAAQPLVPPALQHRHDAGALPRVQGRGCLDPQRPGRAEGVDLASASAATRSTTPTSRRGCASGSPTRWPGTASRRGWTRPTLSSGRPAAFGWAKPEN